MSSDNHLKIPPTPVVTEESFVVASHDVLFKKTALVECDACGGPLGPEDDEGYALQGRGLFVWSRGEGHVIYEEPPLCSHCATAVGVSALTRWAIEEEEG